MKYFTTNTNQDVIGKNQRSTEKTQFTIIIMNLGTWIKDILKDTYVGGFFIKFSQEKKLKIHTEVVMK